MIKNIRCAFNNFLLEEFHSTVLGCMFLWGVLITSLNEYPHLTTSEGPKLFQMTAVT